MFCAQMGNYGRNILKILLQILLISHGEIALFASGFAPTRRGIFEDSPMNAALGPTQIIDLRGERRKYCQMLSVGWLTPVRISTKATNDDDFDAAPGNPKSDEQLPARIPPQQREQRAMTLQEQAQKLREESDAMRNQIEMEKAKKLAKRTAKVDGWIEKLLIEVQIDDSTELLRSEEQVLLRLQEDRFSQEQINAIFNRICELGPQSRSKCSPLMELLVDSVGKMDEVDREENPNKRWNGKVERVLRRRLFAMDWNMDIEESTDEDDMNPWRLK